MSLRNIWVINKRELTGYFSTPVAYVFIIIFLALAGTFTFFLGSFFERNQADLESFFKFHPWLFLFLIPALSMRLWSEERKIGTIELLLTLPISVADAVIGKFLAAWIFAGLALALTFPLWITVSYLGDPDNGVILAGYIGSWLMAGAFLAISSAASALTKNQVVAFVTAATVCFIFTVSGSPLVLDFFTQWAPTSVVDIIASLSFLEHFSAIVQGVIDLKDVIYFVSLIAFALFANAVFVEIKKAQ